jgi:pyroglutamyl-peptidase
VTRPVLVTGFEPYGGRGRNPAGEVAARLDGSEIAGVRVVGRSLPVAFAALDEGVRSTLAEVDPAVVISLGLCPGEPVIRLERIAVNLADFAIPDNDGAVLVDRPLDDGGAAARFSTLPLRPIQEALLRAGIPARLSSSAGTYLCNKALYRFLEAIEELGRAVPCGFIHLPYAPEQVAETIAGMQAARSIERQRRPEIPSMSLELMVKAVHLALEVTLVRDAAHLQAEAAGLPGASRRP